MKLRNLFIAMLAAAGLVSSCQEADFGAASLSVDATSVTLPLEGGSKTFTLNTTRDWTIAVEAVGNSSIDGIVVTPSNGRPSHDAQTITVVAEKNTGRNRQAVIIVKASTESKEITFSQAGELGNQMSIDEVMSSETGTALTVRNALVYGVNTRGFVMGDETGLILVYDETEQVVAGVKVGDVIDIEGKVGQYGIPQVLPTKVTVLSSNNDVPALDPTVITKENIAFADRSMVNYVELEGIYVKSGDYNNIKVIGSTVSGSISYPLESLGLADMIGEVVKVRGYYSGGTSEYYYNILVTEVLEHKPLDADSKTVAEVRSAVTDELVKVTGTVMGVHARGLVVKDATDAIYVYTNTVPEAVVGNKVTIIGLKSVNYGVHQITPLKVTVDEDAVAAPEYGEPVDLTTLAKLNAYSINADNVALDFIKVSGTLDGLNITYASEEGVSQNKMPLMNYTIDSYDFLGGKELTVSGYIVSYNSTKTPPTVGILVVDIETDPYLFADKDNITVLPDVVSAEISVKSNVDWTAATEADWLTVSKEDGKAVLSFDAYTGTEQDRTATIVITAEGVDPVEVSFTQRKAVAGGILAEYELTKMDGWNTNYEHRTMSFETLTVEFDSANKQTQTITDCPVTKGGPIVIKMVEGKEIVSITCYFKQWNSKAQTASLYASVDGGATFEAEANSTSDDFTLASAALPSGTDAVKVLFSSKDNQVGFSKIEVIYKDKQ